MATSVSTPGPHDPDQPDQATEKATLHIRTEQADITVNAQGASAGMLTLGVIGPSATILIGHYAGLPVWAIAIISVLQLVAFITRRGT